MLISTLVLILFFSCDNNDEVNDENQLTGIRWILVKQVGQAGYTIPTDITPEPGEEYWIEFEIASVMRPS